MFERRGMVDIFNGRSESSEIIEFNEHLLVQCLSYMEEEACPGMPRSLKERLFGLYSLYTFFFIQQESHVVQIRMNPDCARNFRKFAQFLLVEKIYDAYVVCKKLLQNNTIKHVAFLSIHDPCYAKSNQTDEKSHGVPVLANLNDPLCRVKALTEQFDMLGVIHREYSKLKDKFGITGNPLNDPTEILSRVIEKNLKAIEDSAIEKVFDVDQDEQSSVDALSSDGDDEETEKDPDIAENDDNVEETIEPSLPSRKRKRKRRQSKTVPISDPEVLDDLFAREILRDNQPTTSDDSAQRMNVDSKIVPGRKKSRKMSAKKAKINLPRIVKSEQIPPLRGIMKNEDLNNSESCIHENVDIVLTQSDSLKNEIKSEIVALNSSTKTSFKSSRRVSFREKENGELDNTIHEIPRRCHSSDESDEENSDEDPVAESSHRPHLTIQLKPIHEKYETSITDDFNIFKPVEGAEETFETPFDSLIPEDIDSDDEI